MKDIFRPMAVRSTATRFGRFTRVSAALLAGALMCLAGAAQASFSIIPVGLSLTPQKATDLITVHNSGVTAIRLQLSVFSWNQKPDGKMLLAPSDDVVFYPPIVTVGANEDRIIRVGAGTPFGLTEKCYRVIAEEMPPPPEAPALGQEKQVHTKVVVLTKLSLPVFLLPPNTVHSQSIRGAAFRDGRLSFQIRNDGNTHLTVGYAKVQGMGASNKVVFERATTLNLSYILPGEYTLYNLDVPKKECSGISKFNIIVPVGKPFGEYNIKGETLQASLNVTPDECGTALGALSPPAP